MTHDKRVTLTPHQQGIVDQVVAWFSDAIAGRTSKLELTLGGLAGTGKTTSLFEVLDAIRPWKVEVAAFTGKAVSVLRGKGMQSARTLHSLMYKPIETPHGIEFEKKDSVDCHGVIVDEASMVDFSLYRDLQSYRVPVLYVGDMGQLEPIGNDPKLMKSPDLMLTEIHRQAWQSAIVRFAHHVRKGKTPATFKDGGDDLTVMSKTGITAEDDYDLILCGFNNTRQKINQGWRACRGYRGTVCSGDKVIVLKNEREFGVYNGLIGFVTDVYESDKIVTRVRVEFDDGIPRVLPVATNQFGTQKTLEEANRRDLREQPEVKRVYMDYAGAITCHKAQGSQGDKVAVAEELWSRWDSRRWRYTAATRAAKDLTYGCRIPRCLR